MKKTAIIAGLLVALTGCGSGSHGPAVNPHGKCSHPFSAHAGVQVCRYADGSLYSVSYRYENQYYWHPANGYFAVAETFYKQNAPGRAAGAWKGRTISVGDSCVIDENWIPNTKTGPPDCMDSRTGENRGSTGEEQRSVLKFWQIMTRYIPASAR
jgi:hypothetical protein